MRDAVLLGCTIAVFIYGYFLMKRLDAFLENNRNGQDHSPGDDENSLRIGLSDPLAADGLSDVLETYGKQHPDVAVHMFSGEAGELCKKLETHKLDMIFLPKDTIISEKARYHAQTLLLRCTPVIMKYAGLPIEPITRKHITQKALWRDSETSPAVKSFVGCLNEFAGDQSQM